MFDVYNARSFGLANFDVYLSEAFDCFRFGIQTSCSFTSSNNGAANSAKRGMKPADPRNCCICLTEVGWLQDVAQKFNLLATKIGFFSTNG